MSNKGQTKRTERIYVFLRPLGNGEAYPTGIIHVESGEVLRDEANILQVMDFLEKTNPGNINRQKLERYDDIKKGLESIILFAFKNPGCGFSCGQMAKELLDRINKIGVSNE